MFDVVTIELEYGSGGAAIAQRVAQYLGWRLLDNKLIDAVARHAQVDREIARQYDESIDPWWRRIHGGAFRTALHTLGGAPDVPFFDSDVAEAAAHEVIADAAGKRNCVIVGRGAQCILQHSAEAFHVLVHAHGSSASVASGAGRMWMGISERCCPRWTPLAQRIFKDISALIGRAPISTT
jgi:hypothetical protein